MKATVEQVAAAGGYSIILADPPWSYKDMGKGCIGHVPYKTMSAEAIAALPVERLAAKNAVLFLWATHPKIHEALDLIPRWGFEFKSIAFMWIKTKGAYPDGSGKPFLGLGRWTRGNTEPCYLAVRGKPTRMHAGVSQLMHTLEEDLVIAPVGRHSAKPPEVRERIVNLMGNLPRIELFAREASPGWDCWGDEVTGGPESMFVQVAA